MKSARVLMRLKFSRLENSRPPQFHAVEHGAIDSYGSIRTVPVHTGVLVEDKEVGGGGGGGVVSLHLELPTPFPLETRHSMLSCFLSFSEQIRSD